MYNLTLFIFCFFICFKVLSQPNVVIDGASEIILLGKNAVFFEDEGRLLSFDQVRQPSFEKNFRIFPQEILNLSTTSSAVWLKLNLTMKTNKRYYLQIDNPDIDSAFFYFPNQQQEYQYRLTGKSLPSTSATIASTHYTVEIPQIDHQQPQNYYLRLTSKRYIIVDIKAVSQNTLLNTLLKRYMLELIFFGVVFLSALYNLFVFISIKDISYLYYVIYTALIGLNVANTRGYLYLFFPQAQAFIAEYSFLSSALYIPFITLFTISFLKVRQHNIWLYRGLLLLLCISIAHITLTLLGFGGLLFKALHTFLFFNLVCYMIAGVFVFLKGYKPSIYFLFSWGIFSIFTTLAILSYTNIIAFTWFSKYLTPLGAMIETIISAVGLTNRISVLKNEKEKIQKEKIDLIESQKDTLEQKVTQRTQEVERQNSELKQYQQELLTVNELLHHRTELVEKQHDEIEILNKDLEKRIENRTDELQSALDSLTQQNQDLEQFSYIISHNIRSPIARIQGLINIFNKENFNEEFNKEIFKHLEHAIISLDVVIKDLTHIISIRKDLNKVKEDINLTELLDSELFFLHDEIVVAQAKISKNIEANTVFSIKSYVQNIIHNLISNAIKYRNPKKALQIDINIKEEQRYLIITVQDSGLGIDVEKTDMYKIFGLYQRMHIHVEGKGLGLYLVKTQVDALQGKITVESKTNEGAIFRVFLPIV